MRSEEVEEAIKVLDKYKIRLLQTRKEIGLVEDFKNHHTEKQYNRCGKRANAIDTVLAYIEELEKENKFLRDENNIYRNETVGKKRIRDKIKELEELNFNNYANEYDNGNEVKYYILKEFKEILGE